MQHKEFFFFFLLVFYFQGPILKDLWSKVTVLRSKDIIFPKIKY